MSNRYSILATGAGRPVQNADGLTERLAVLLADRRANGEAFPGERVVRLPRRLFRGRDAVWVLEAFGRGGVAAVEAIPRRAALSALARARPRRWEGADGLGGYERNAGTCVGGDGP